MYCIDIDCTLKDCKPTLILESLNRDQNQHAKNTLGVDLTQVGKDVAERLQNLFVAPQPSYNLAVC